MRINTDLGPTTLLGQKNMDAVRAQVHPPASGATADTLWRVPETDIASERATLAFPDDESLLAPIRHLKDLLASTQLQHKELQRIKDVLERCPRPKREKGATKVKLPPVPALVCDVPQPYLYGWAVTNDWLNLLGQAGTPHTGIPMPAGQILSGMPVLRLLAGADDSGVNLALQYCRAVHAHAPLWDSRGEMGSCPWDALTFSVVAACTTVFECDYAGARPTEAQYVWLKAVMPGEPQWFRSAYSRDGFIRMIIMTASNSWRP